MRTKKRIHPYVTPDLANRLATYCGAKGITESAAVQAAVEDHLNGEANDNEVIMRRLDRLSRASVCHQRDIGVLTESFAVFVRAWFAVQPQMAEADKPVADRLGEKRYLHFVDYVSKQLATGSGLAADIAKIPPTGAATGAGAPAGPPAAAGNRYGER